MARARLPLALTLLLSFVTASPLSAGKYNRVLSIGDSAPHFEGLEGVDGRQYALDDFADKKVLVVAFTCNTCPYAVDYQDRLNEFARQHAGDDSPVGIIAINANTIPEDRLPAMKQRAEEEEFVFPYVSDPTQKIAKAFGAAWTPEFFVLDQQRRVIYMGAFDDSADRAKVEKQYVEPAVEAALAGKEAAVSETPAVGCTIRFERSRRQR